MAEALRRQQRRIAGGAILGPLESEIMAVFWNRGACTVRDVLHSLLPKTPAYTTVLSTVSRLRQKGLLIKQDQHGLTFVFSPSCTKHEWLVSTSREIVKWLLVDLDVTREVLLSALQEALRV
jgi:predicted transcriptional regulator